MRDKVLFKGSEIEGILADCNITSYKSISDNKIMIRNCSELIIQLLEQKGLKKLSQVGEYTVFLVMITEV